MVDLVRELFEVDVHNPSVPFDHIKLKGKVRELCRRGRGRNHQRFIQEDLNAKLRGWAVYFRLAEVRGIFEELDAWLRRRIRCQQWRQWKRPPTRKKELMVTVLKKMVRLRDVKHPCGGGRAGCP